MLYVIAALNQRTYHLNAYLGIIALVSLAIEYIVGLLNTFVIAYQDEIIRVLLQIVRG